MNPNVKEVTQENSKVICNFCHKWTVNSLEWGPLYQLDGVTVHYFCLLFSAGLSQNGEDDEGILGFLPNDIRKEVKRGAKLKCRFCRKPNATIGCSKVTCTSSYHYPCGLGNGSAFQFLGNYESYCSKHKKKTELPREGWIKQRDCPICYREFGASEPTIWPTCCRKKALFHKRCLMETAKTHGVHFFKCPLCYDKGTFLVAMQMAGIYVPEMDAAWEIEPNAFEEHRQLYSHCDADHCLCPKGRDHSSKRDSEPWKIVRCGACGASAIHMFCGKLENLTWRCVTCAAILAGKRKSLTLNSSRIQRGPCATSSSTNHTLVARRPSQVRKAQGEVESSTQVRSSFKGKNTTSHRSNSGEELYDRSSQNFAVDADGTGRTESEVDEQDKEDEQNDPVFISPKSIVYQQLLNGAAEETLGAPAAVRKCKAGVRRAKPIPVPIGTSTGQSPAIPVTSPAPVSSANMSDSSPPEVPAPTDLSPSEIMSGNEVASLEAEMEGVVILECRSLAPIHETKSGESEVNNNETGESYHHDNSPEPGVPIPEDQPNTNITSEARSMIVVADEEPEAPQSPDEDIIIDVEDPDSEIEIIWETAPPPPPPTIAPEVRSTMSRLQEHCGENGYRVTPLVISSQGLNAQQKDYLAFVNMILGPKEVVHNHSAQNEGSGEVKRQDSGQGIITLDEDDGQNMAYGKKNGTSSPIANAKNGGRAGKRKCEEVED